MIHATTNKLRAVIVVKPRKLTLYHGEHVANYIETRSPAVAEGPRDAGVPVEILAAVERLYYTTNEYRSRVCVSLTAYVKVHSHRRD